VARGTLLAIDPREPLHQGAGRLPGSRWGRRDMAHTTAGGEGLGTAPIAEPPVVAQALQALGEDRQQEAPHALRGGQCPHLDGIALAIIAPAERDHAVLQGHEARMTDRDALRVAAEIRHHLLRPCEGWLGIADPVLPPHGLPPARKRGRLCQWGCPHGTVSLPVGEGVVEAIEILPAKDPREGADGEEELATRRRHPPVLLSGEGATRRIFPPFFGQTTT
jgi:hypothetical protein